MRQFLFATCILGGACSYTEAVGTSALETDAGATDSVAADASSGSNIAYEGTPFNWMDRTGDDLVFLAGEDPTDFTGHYGHPKVMRIDASGALQTLGNLPAYDRIGEGIAQDSDTVYTSVQFAPGDFGILAFDKATGVTTTVTSGWEHVGKLTVYGDDIYFVQTSGGRLARVSKTGTGAVILASGFDAPASVKVDDHYAYVADDLNHRIVAVQTSGAHAQLVVASDVNRPYDMVPVGDWLYLTERGDLETDGKVSRVHRPAASATQGSLDPTVEVLVSGLAHPSELVIDTRHLYWTSYFHGLESAPLAGGSATTVLTNNQQGFGPVAAFDDTIYMYSRRPLVNTGPLGQLDGPPGALIYRIEK